MPRPALLVALLASTLAPSASAQVEARLADLRLATAVRLALVDDVRTRAFDLEVAARDGGVEVRGDVPPALRPTVGEVARAVRGVRVVGGEAASGGAGDVPARPLLVQPAPSADPPRPATPEASRPDGPAVHTVEAGDTLFSLARRYGTTVAALLELNGMAAPDIRVGQRLRVR